MAPVTLNTEQQTRYPACARHHLYDYRIPHVHCKPSAVPE
jgi:hypothetical protein